MYFLYEIINIIVVFDAKVSRDYWGREDVDYVITGERICRLRDY